MGCSSCETFLDRYVDGDLEPRRAAWVARHLQQCAECELLHRRLRVVDALLETVRPFELHGEFTPSVMAGVLGLPLPAAARRPWPILSRPTFSPAGSLWRARSSNSARPAWVPGLRMRLADFSRRLGRSRTPYRRSPRTQSRPSYWY